MYVTLSQGVSGPPVAVLQDMLRTLLFYNGETDGVYSASVRSAVASWQRCNGQSANGAATGAQQQAMARTAASLKSQYPDGGYELAPTQRPVAMAAAKSRIKLYKKASTRKGKLTTIKKNQQMRVLSHGRKWTLVQYGGRTGYVKTAKLRFFTGQETIYFYQATPEEPLPEDLAESNELSEEEAEEAVDGETTAGAEGKAAEDEADAETAADSQEAAKAATPDDSAKETPAEAPDESTAEASTEPSGNSEKEPPAETPDDPATEASTETPDDSDESSASKSEDEPPEQTTPDAKPADGADAGTTQDTGEARPSSGAEDSEKPADPTAPQVDTEPDASAKDADESKVDPAQWTDAGAPGLMLDETPALPGGAPTDGTILGDGAIAEDNQDQPESEEISVQFELQEGDGA